MQILIILKKVEEVQDKSQITEDLVSLLKKEAAMVWNMQKEDFIRTISFIKGEAEYPNGVVIMSEAKNKKEALDKISELPMSKAGKLTVEMYELSPFTNYELLFEK